MLLADFQPDIRLGRLLDCPQLKCGAGFGLLGIHQNILAWFRFCFHAILAVGENA
jgi:hypothetical protein